MAEEESEIRHTLPYHRVLLQSFWSTQLRLMTSLFLLYTFKIHTYTLHFLNADVTAKVSKHVSTPYSQHMETKTLNVSKL